MAIWGLIKSLFEAAPKDPIYQYDKRIISKLRFIDFTILDKLKQKTIKTKWITAEIDRITALIYFMITLSVFIVAIVILPDLLHKFAKVFMDIGMIG